MNDKPKSKWYWRLLRWGLIGVAVLVTLAAVLVTEENWRGKRDWQAYRQAAEARGDRFDWSAFSPTNVPDDENFARALVFSGLTTMTWDEKTQDWKPSDTNAFNRLKMSTYRTDGSTPKGLGASWEQAQLTQLKRWQEFYRSGTNDGAGEFPVAAQPQSPAADVLLALSKYDSVIEELRAASSRPYFRHGGYSANSREFSQMMTWLGRFKGMAQVLRLRAIAELDDHQNAKALTDVLLLLRLDDELRQEPLLIGHLVSIAISSLALQPIYEGLAQHRWNEDQLAQLERALAAKDFLADYLYAMRGERIFAIDMMENIRITREYKTSGDEGGKEVTMNLGWTPAAFFYQNELALARGNEEFLQPLVDVTNRLVSPTALLKAESAVKQQMKQYSPYKMLALARFPAVSRSLEKFATIQESVDLARVACALERYRLEHGEYPTALDALAPQFIEHVPHDLINGQPLHYQRSENGNFVLYSVGWNEKDDGGTVALTKEGNVNHERGDWVWTYAGK